MIFFKLKISLIIIIALAALLLFFSLFLLNFKTSSNALYLADEILVVLNNDKSSSENYDFILNQARILESASKKTVIIFGNDIREKNKLESLIKESSAVYLDIFRNFLNKKDSVLVFDNDLALNQPFSFMSYLDSESRLKIIYDKKNQEINFISSGQVLMVNGVRVKLNDLKIYSVKNVKANNLLAIGETIINLNDYPNNLTVATEDLIKNRVSLYLPKTANLLAKENYSFETGLWHEEVSDCSAYLPGQADLAMNLSSQASAGAKALQLSAKNHFACSLKTFSINLPSDKIYQLSFDYKNIVGDKIQYYYNLSNNRFQNQDKFEALAALDHDWHTFSAFISPKIDEINKLELYFYAPSDGSKEMVNLYDNIRLTTFEFERREFISSLNFTANYPFHNSVKLSAGKNTFSFLSSENNLLADFNPSFETGLWHEEVFDCSAYLPGQADLAMNLSSQASAGAKALQLSATNHFACSLKTFSINLPSDKIYQLSFDYKNIVGDKIQYYYNLSNNRFQNQDKFEALAALDHDWHTFSAFISPKIDEINKLELYFYAPSDGSKEMVNLYDNIRLKAVAPKEIFSYYLYFKNKQINNNNVSLRKESLNRWQQTIYLNGVKEPILLVDPQNFSANWFLSVFRYNSDISAGNRWFSGLAGILNPGLKQKNHFMVNRHSNGWLIDPGAFCDLNDYCLKNSDGSYNIKLSLEHNFRRLSFFLNFSLVLILILITFTLWK